MKKLFRIMFVVVTTVLMIPIQIIVTLFQLGVTVIAAIKFKEGIWWSFGYYVAGMKHGWMANMDYIKNGEYKEFMTIVNEAFEEHNSLETES